ncbi:hypothetical protein [Sphingomonas sp.]|uniref:hypothetical protein n=1 Tax=Sphingomonas sp. TaxID=28214 RepID=UPI003B3A7156
MAGKFSIGGWRSRVTTGVGGIAAVVAGWGIGLFELKTTPPPPGLAAAKPVDAGEWTLRLDGVSVSDRMPDGGRIIGSDRKAIILHLQATNRTGMTSNSFVRAIHLDTPIRGIDAHPTPFLQRDRVATGELQPALPEDMTLVWTYPAGEPVPAKLRFSIDARSYRDFDNLYAQPGWFDPQKIGVIELPLSPAEAASKGAAS